MNTATKTVTATGTLKTALTTEWTLAITAQDITQSSGVTVTQGSVTGTLKTAVSGATTSVVVTTASGVVFITTTDVVIGSNEGVLLEHVWEAMQDRWSTGHTCLTSADNKNIVTGKSFFRCPGKCITQIGPYDSKIQVSNIKTFYRRHFLVE